MQGNTDIPPSYNAATSEGDRSELRDAKGQDKAPKPAQHDDRQPLAPGPSMPMFHYTNPQNGHQINSPLPPNHPEMICLQAGGHITHTKFGILGILAAVFWFPLGIGLCLLDRRVQCRRCGMIIDDGLSC